MFENLFPYTDFHELNLDAILRMIKALHQEWTDFQAVNAITNAGAWDITKQYQAWTVVSDNNIGYISLKPVPAGVAITNTEYWGVIADYDILITNLSARISALETDNTYLMNEIVKKSNKVQKILIIGDSYLDRSNSYGDYLAGCLTDATVVLRGEAGAGFTSYSTLGVRTFEGILNLYIAGLTDDEKASFTDIIAIGGSNDRGHSSATVSAAIATFFNIAKATFTNARFHIGFLGWTGFSSTYQSADKLSFLAMKDVYKQASCDNNLCWIENLNYNMHDYSHYADEGHPDQVASERIGKFLFDYIKTGHADVHIKTSATFTLNSANFTVGQFDQGIANISGEIVNGITRFAVNGPKPNFQNYTKIALTASGLPASGNMVALCSLSGGAVFGIEENTGCYPVVESVPATVSIGGNIISVMIGVTVLHGSLSLLLLNSVTTWNQVTWLCLAGFNIEIPTDYA